MFSKLPTKIWSGVLLLAFVAGSVNVIGFLSFNHQGLSHLTGVTSMLGAAISAGNLSQALHLFAAIAAFVGGCAISGALIQDSTLRIRKSYAMALFLVSGLLVFSIPLFRAGQVYAIYLSSMACGIQNAMVTTYSGAALRTTHISGMFTDLGIAIGHLMRGTPTDSRRLRLCAVVISGFFSGGIVSSYLYSQFDYNALLLPAALTCSLGVVTLKLKTI